MALLLFALPAGLTLSANSCAHPNVRQSTLRSWVACRRRLHLTLLACASLVLRPCAVHAQLDKTALTWMRAVLGNWEAVSRRDLRIRVDTLPWMIFYDDGHAWHLNPDFALLPVGSPSGDTLYFAGKRYPMVSIEHRNNALWVPGRAAIPLDGSRSPVAAMPYANDRNAFLISPLPARFRQLAAPDQAHELDEMFLGLAAHELIHTQQLARALQQIKRLRARHPIPESVDDNVIQRAFEPNDVYRQLYQEERGHLARAVLATDLDSARHAASDAIALSQKRKERFFVGTFAGFADLDDVVLAMEGAAMWVQYRTARERAPAGEDWLRTISVLSARHSAWSQEEGLALFLLIDRLVPNWQQRFFSSQTDLPSPFRTVEEAIHRRRHDD